MLQGMPRVLGIAPGVLIVEWVACVLLDCCTNVMLLKDGLNDLWGSFVANCPVHVGKDLLNSVGAPTSLTYLPLLLW